MPLSLPIIRVTGTEFFLVPLRFTSSAAASIDDAAVDYSGPHGREGYSDAISKLVALTEVVPLSSPMVSATCTGFLDPAKSAPCAFAANA
jgi:hypothetical protein